MLDGGGIGLFPGHGVAQADPCRGVQCRSAQTLRVASTALSLSSATWTWDSDTDGIVIEDESDMSDSIVSRQGTNGITATSFDIGVLSFNAPAALGTYTVNLTAGDADTEPLPDNTLMADGTTTIYEDNDLTLGTFSFTVVPEPGTAVLLACGALAALLRRRKAKA